MTQTGKSDYLPATVPGCIHTDLLAQSRIPDPFVSTNELDVMWVADASWTYSHTFKIEDYLLSNQYVLLLCHGLDTLAKISVNGSYLASTENMFRSYELDIKNLLQVGTNDISISFEPSTVYGKKRLEERWLANWGVPEGEKLPGVNYLRKAQCHFGWDWGPKLATCGIWRDIEIVAYSITRLKQVYIRQQHEPLSVTLFIEVEAEKPLIEEMNCQVLVSHNGDQISEESCSISGRASFQSIIQDPQLWWPNGLGRQPLYQVVVNLTTSSGKHLNQTVKTIGLRTLKLIRKPDEWGESFHFEVNGVPFFAKGGNWIPADAFMTRVTPSRYQALLSDCAKVNMNMIRVWGGGIYEDDHFYRICDELGLCVWQDFMFACAAYPVFDSAWLKNVLEEAKENVLRLRHHACLALWCGNNEIEQGLVGNEYTRDTMSWADYSLLFDKKLRDIVTKFNEDIAYWPGSPHSPVGNRTDYNNPRWGDAHLWGVWHGKERFEWYQTCEHRFNSEFGFQSFPDIHTVRKYVSEDERNVTSRVMEHHQRSGIGNQTIVHYILEWFRLPTEFKKLLWVSQITQGMAMKYAVEHWRRSMPRGMGTLYWQINDCWPVTSWSSVDYYGRWKALHFMAREFFKMVLVTGVENIQSGVVQISVVNDNTHPVTGNVCWELWETDGDRAIESGSEKIRAGPLQNTESVILNCSAALKSYLPCKIIASYWMEQDGKRLSENTSFFVRPKHLKLIDPKICMVISKKMGSWRTKLTATAWALWVFIDDEEGEIQPDGGFFHLAPGLPREVSLSCHNVSVLANLTQQQMANRLRVRSLFSMK